MARRRHGSRFRYAPSPAVAAGSGSSSFYRQIFTLPFKLTTVGKLKSGEDTLLEGTSQLCYNPRSKESGLTEDGKESVKCKNNDGNRKYYVTEFDRIKSFKDQSLLIGYLAQYCPLVMVMTSGGKSLHGIFDVEAISEVDFFQFAKLATRLGGDPAMIVKSQVGRMPWGLREEGDEFVKQTVVAFYEPDERNQFDLDGINEQLAINEIVEDKIDDPDLALDSGSCKYFYGSALSTHDSQSAMFSHWCGGDLRWIEDRKVWMAWDKTTGWGDCAISTVPTMVSKMTHDLIDDIETNMVYSEDDYRAKNPSAGVSDILNAKEKHDESKKQFIKRVRGRAIFFL